MVNEQGQKMIFKKLRIYISNCNPLLLEPQMLCILSEIRNTFFKESFKSHNQPQKDALLITIVLCASFNKLSSKAPSSAYLTTLKQFASESKCTELIYPFFEQLSKEELKKTLPSLFSQQTFDQQELVKFDVLSAQIKSRMFVVMKDAQGKQISISDSQKEEARELLY